MLILFKEFFKLVLIGVISGIVVLVISWYYVDLRGSLKLSIEVENLKDDLHSLKLQVSNLELNLNDLAVQFARIDERTKVKNYNQQKFNQLVEKKQISPPDIDSAIKFLNSKPTIKEAINYLEQNLGFSAKDAKAIVAPSQENVKDELEHKSPNE